MCTQFSASIKPRTYSRLFFCFLLGFCFRTFFVFVLLTRSIPQILCDIQQYSDSAHNSKLHSHWHIEFVNILKINYTGRSGGWGGRPPPQKKRKNRQTDRQTDRHSPPPSHTHKATDSWCFNQNRTKATCCSINVQNI